MSRDIIFHERHFPFPLHSSSTTTQFQFFLPVVTDYTPYIPTQLPEVFQTVLSTSENLNHQISHDHTATSDIHIEYDSSIVLRKSTRVSKPPPFLNDFVYNNCTLDFNVHVHWCNLISSQYFSSSHHDFLAHTNSLIEPHNYEEACKDPRWIEAMAKELNALQANHTWDMVLLPPGKKTNWM